MTEFIFSLTKFYLKNKENLHPTFALPCLTQSIPSRDPSLVWIIRTRSGPDNCWITSVADDF